MNLKTVRKAVHGWYNPALHLVVFMNPSSQPIPPSARFDHENHADAARADRGIFGGVARMRRPISNSLRWAILRRDNFSCRYCGHRAVDGAVLVLDHAISVADGGSDHITNLVACCEPCNAGKGADSVLRTLPRQDVINLAGALTECVWCLKSNYGHMPTSIGSRGSAPGFVPGELDAVLDFLVSRDVDDTDTSYLLSEFYSEAAEKGLDWAEAGHFVMEKIILAGPPSMGPDA